ncbi:MAG: hypothetical protein WBV82_11435 [Myxococcaceae bacterium]
MILPVFLLLAAAPSPEPFLDAARQIEQGLQAGSPDALRSVLDMGDLAERAIQDVDAPADSKKGFIKGASKNSFATNLAAAISQGGRIKLLRLVGDPSRPRALYRFLHANAGGVNYYELYLAPKGDRIVVTDVFTFSNGERFSETLRRAFATAAGQANQGILERLLGKERDYVVHAEKIKALAAMVQEGRFEESMKAFDALPASLRKDRTLLVLRMQAAANLSPEVSEAAVTDFEQAYPGDPALMLFSIDVHFNRKAFDAALAAVEQLDARVKDPYLHVLRSGVYIGQKKYELAKKGCLKSMEEEPDLADVYWSLVTVSLAAKDHSETARVLDLIEKRFNLQIGDLTAEPDYVEFVKSAAYKKWMKKRAG